MVAASFSTLRRQREPRSPPTRIHCGGPNERGSSPTWRGSVAATPGEAPTERASECWGESFASTLTDSTVAYEITGKILGALEQEPPRATVTSAAYESVTLDLLAVGDAIRGDHWLYAYGDFSSPLVKEIKKNIRYA